MDLQSTYNYIAEDWMHDHQNDTWWIEGTDAFASYLQPGASILDVGCGSGAKSAYLSAKGFQVVGFDFSEEMIRLAREVAPQATFYLKDMSKPLGFEPVFDGVFAQAALLHIPKNEVMAVLRTILTPLKSGGYFYAAVKNIRPGGKEEEIVQENDYGYPYERFFSYFSASELDALVQDAGLDLIESRITPFGKTNWLWVIAKKP